MVRMEPLWLILPVLPAPLSMPPLQAEAEGSTMIEIISLHASLLSKQQKHLRTKFTCIRYSTWQEANTQSVVVEGTIQYIHRLN